MAKRGRPKKPKSRRERVFKAIDALLDSDDPKDKAQGARLYIATQQKLADEDKTVVDPLVGDLMSLIVKLELALGDSIPAQALDLSEDEKEMGTGRLIIAILQQQISDVEQLVRRKVSELRISVSDNAV